MAAGTTWIPRMSLGVKVVFDELEPSTGGAVEEGGGHGIPPCAPTRSPRHGHVNRASGGFSRSVSSRPPACRPRSEPSSRRRPSDRGRQPPMETLRAWPRTDCGRESEGIRGRFARSWPSSDQRMLSSRARPTAAPPSICRGPRPATRGSRRTTPAVPRPSSRPLTRESSRSMRRSPPGGRRRGRSP